LGKINWIRGTCYNMCIRTLIVACLIMSMYKTTRVSRIFFSLMDFSEGGNGLLYALTPKYYHYLKSIQSNASMK
jgi:hypothetical protein